MEVIEVVTHTVRVTGLEVTLGLWVVVTHFEIVRGGDKDTVTLGVLEKAGV